MALPKSFCAVITGNLPVLEHSDPLYYASQFYGTGTGAVRGEFLLTYLLHEAGKGRLLRICLALN